MSVFVSMSNEAMSLPLTSWPAKAGHPRLSLRRAPKTWMAGPSPAMTMKHGNEY
jgi:hypothetical protein